MKFLKYLLVITVMSSTLSISVQAQDATDIQRIVELGYDESVAARISKYRPDIAYLLTHPTLPVSFEIPKKKNSDDVDVLPQIDQSGAPILLYRGINIGLDQYDPRFVSFHLGTTEGKMYSTMDLTDGVEFAGARKPEDNGKDAIVLELQVPSFFALHLAAQAGGIGHNWRVLLRDVMPDDAVFLKRIGTLKQVSDMSYWANLQGDVSKVVNWQEFDKIKGLIPKLKLSPESPLKR